jgi:acetyl-CoA acetyltransferase
LRFEITLEQALAAPTVVTPFGLYDCAPQSDGAAALVLAAEDVVDRFTDRPVWIRGVGLGLDSVMHQHKPDMTTFPATTRAAKQAFAMAGMTPADVDVAEVHDFFTGIELISYEDLGFAERFGGYKLVEAEVTSVGGALPVNPSGGLKAKGHPPGATGVAQCVGSRNSEERRPTRWMAHGLRWRTTSADRRRCRLSPSWKDRPMARGSGPERWSAGCHSIRNLSGDAGGRRLVRHVCGCGALHL